jgi:uncharacterized protein YcbK (DUF882 family)
MLKTAHYSKDEFTCKCGCGGNLATIELLNLCELVRMLNGNTPLPVSSGTRCTGYNAKVGGAWASKHVLGQAADLPVEDPEYVYDKLRKIFLYSHGLGLYNTFVHVDIRERKGRW